MNEIKYAEKLINYYETKTPTKLDELKSLDKKVKKPAYLFAYIFGILGSLILGTGMCLAMKIIGGTNPLMIIGIIVGIVALCSLTFLR